ENAESRYEGAMTARQALAKSKNGATVRIGMDAGIDAVLQLSAAAGIHSPLRPYPATFLGSSEVTLAELALAYTIFPNGGWRPNVSHILERIEEKDGSLVSDTLSFPTRCLPDMIQMSHAPFGQALTSRKRFIAARLDANWRC